MFSQPVHLTKKYKKFAFPSRVLIFFLCYGIWTIDCGLYSAEQSSLPSPSGNQLAATGGGQEEQLLQATLNQVEFIAKNTKTLEEFGKETLSQSQVFLDLKNSGVPLLLQALKRKEKNWKVQYWAADMLGYVGETSAEKELLSLVSDQSQARLVRLRALDSILEIERRGVGIGKQELRPKLRKIARNTKDSRVKKKIQRMIAKLQIV